MSLQIGKIERLIRQKPYFSDIPFIIVSGKPMSPREALSNLRGGRLVSEIASAMAKAGYDPGENEWKLTEEYYRRLSLGPAPPIIGRLHTPMTFADALREVRGRTALGRELVEQHMILLREMRASLR